MNETKRDSLAKATPEGMAQLPDHGNLRALAGDLLNSGLFPAVKNVAGAITIIEYGRELGIPPVAALQTMAIVQGRLCMEAKAMLAVFQSHGGRIKILERSKTAARVELAKEGLENYVHEYTMDQARQEKLSGKDNWLKMPETMLFWRAIATGIRLFDPGSIFGLYSKEEMVDVAVRFSGPLPTTEVVEGEVVEEKAVPKPPVKTDNHVHGAKAGASTVDELPGGKDSSFPGYNQLAVLRDELVGVMASCERAEVIITKAEWDRVKALKEEAEYKKAIGYFRDKLGVKLAMAQEDTDLFETKA